MSEMMRDNNDELISSLSYKNPTSASYIISRNSSTFHCVGGNIYTPNAGAKLIKFYLTAEDFLDPQSLRVQFDLVCTDTDANKYLMPLGAPHGFFSRCRCLARGEIIDDITDFNRVSEMFSFLKSYGSVQNDMLESFGYEAHRGAPEAKELFGIKSGTYQTVLFKPMIGLLNQPKYISLKYVPLTIELELDSDKEANIVTPNVTTQYPTAEVSNMWEIRNPIIRCDIVKVDSELQNKYDDHFASGGGINIKYTTYNSQILKILGTSFTINLSRSLTYLTRIFVSFLKTYNTTGNPKEFWNKNYNTFYHTLRHQNTGASLDAYSVKYNQSDDIVQSAQIQIGSKLIPDYPMRSTTEAFYFLRKALNTDHVFPSHVHSIDIYGKEYLDYKFVMCFDCEQINGKQLLLQE